MSKRGGEDEQEEGECEKNEVRGKGGDYHATYAFPRPSFLGVCTHVQCLLQLQKREVIVITCSTCISILKINTLATFVSMSNTMYIMHIEQSSMYMTVCAYIQRLHSSVTSYPDYSQVMWPPGRGRKKEGWSGRYKRKREYQRHE